MAGSQLAQAPCVRGVVSRESARIPAHGTPATGPMSQNYGSVPRRSVSWANFREGFVPNCPVPLRAPPGPRGCRARLGCRTRIRARVSARTRIRPGSGPGPGPGNLGRGPRVPCVVLAPEGSRRKRARATAAVESAHARWMPIFGLLTAKITSKGGSCSHQKVFQASWALRAPNAPGAPRLHE